MIISGIDFKLLLNNFISCTALFVVLLISWNPNLVQAQRLVLGAEQFYAYEDLIKNKNVGVVVNQTSRVQDDHLVDFLVEKGINIEKIFSPEHGFRGEADAGKHIENSKDEKTGIRIISLYGKNRKPTADQVDDLDIIIFDIQDVGTRFYTYISTMHYIMETCAENGLDVVIFDRPNPNGEYVDGPVLRKGFESFVGLHPIPIVHGLTVGELALMINGEKWLTNKLECNLTVIPMRNYSHKDSYVLPIKPSPNLPNQTAIKLYPSLCLFEGTMMSVGRGTDFPFQVVGYPDKSFGRFSFTPESRSGASKPKYMDEGCFGKDFRELSINSRFTINHIIEFYYKSGRNPDFFNDYFTTLAGNDELQKQIEAGLSEEEIRVSWLEELNQYKMVRKKYLLYPDGNI